MIMTKSSETERGLGYKPDPEDTRDVKMSVSPVATGDLDLPLSHSLRYASPWILDQDGMQACVGYSIVEALYTKQRIEGETPVMVSPGFIWSNSRRTHGDEKLNEGTYIREAIKTLKTLGACPDKSWPMSELPFNFMDRPSAEAYKDGYDARFEVDYRRLDAEGEALREQLKTCIFEGHPVVFGITVPKRFLSLKDHDSFEPSESDIAAGGHAMCILGYNERGVFGPNSWGSDWGNSGWFHISWAWFLNEARDKWAITHMARIEV